MQIQSSKREGGILEVASSKHITLIRRVSPLEVSTRSFVSVTAFRYNPATRRQTKIITQEKHKTTFQLN